MRSAQVLPQWALMPAGDINIQLVTLPSLNNLTASIAGAEVLQLLSNPMLTPTSSSDSMYEFLFVFLSFLLWCTTA